MSNTVVVYDQDNLPVLMGTNQRFMFRHNNTAMSEEANRQADVERAYVYLQTSMMASALLAAVNSHGAAFTDVFFNGKTMASSGGDFQIDHLGHTPFLIGPSSNLQTIKGDGWTLLLPNYVYTIAAGVIVEDEEIFHALIAIISFMKFIKNL